MRRKITISFHEASSIPADGLTESLHFNVSSPLCLAEIDSLLKETGRQLLTNQVTTLQDHEVALVIRVEKKPW